MSSYKRKYNSDSTYISGNKLYSNQYISASQIHNYFMDDPLLDFLNRHGERLGLTPDKSGLDPNKVDYNFSKLIMNLGNIWEDRVVAHITELVGENNTVIVKDKNYQSFQASQQLINCYITNKVPVIFQAYLKADLYNDRFHGYVDVLCRLDFIEKIFENSNDLQQLIEDYKNKNILYVPIDIKTSNFTNLSKIDSSYLEYMHGQLHLYCRMNNSDSKYGILVGRQLIKNSKKLDCYVVKIDSLIVSEKIKRCVKWLRQLESEGTGWQILPKPSVNELYPNMKNSHDSEWRSVKNYLAKELKEITDLYYCGVNKRRYCNGAGVYSYLDPEFDNIIQETFRSSPVIKAVNSSNAVEANKSALNNIINIAKTQRGEIPESEIKQLTLAGKTKYIYIDIETVYNFYNCIYDEYTQMESSTGDKEGHSKLDFITQIGIGYINSNNTWVYKSFEMELINFKEEQRIIKECKDYLQVVLDFCEHITFVYFTKAENRVLNTIIKDLTTIDDKKENKPFLSFLDLHSEWCNRNYYLKNLLNFKLKEIIKALNERGKTTLNYDNLTIKDGSSAMALYMIEDKIAKDANYSKISSEAIKLLKEYNETDCKALYEIHKNLFKI